MAATTEHQGKTLYDKYQESLPSQEKSSKGKSFSYFRNKDKKQNGSATEGAAPPSGSNGDVTPNNPGEGSSSQKRKIKKTYKPAPAVHGFKKDEMSLEIMLLQGGFKRIGVVGLPGVGKTTLCRFILQNERVKSSYTLMFWISLWEEAEETEDTVAGDIIQFKSDVQNLPTLLNDHKEKLAENKYLIVLDDVGEAEGDGYYEDLTKCLRHLLPEQKGGAVIVTCRSEEAAKKVVGDDNLHRLQPLNDPNSCWWIYNEAVKGKVPSEDTTVSKEVKEELMKRCGGLPGAARMMGEIKAQHDDKNKAYHTVTHSTFLA